MSALVEIRDLLVRRQRTTVLEIDSLAIPAGRVTALVGPNGAGKTTLLLVLAGLLKPARGEILFGGQPLTGQKDTLYRRRIGLVMQNALMLDRSVEENVAVGLRFRGLSRAEITPHVDEWLARLRIEHLRGRRATSLSGGEGQRVALARALVLDPELLLLDEPFQSLDEASHASLLADLKALLPRARTTILFSTHSQKDVRELAEERVALKSGKLAH